MARHIEIAETIRDQLKTIDWAALMAWGAKNFSALEGVKGGIHPHLGGLHFKVNGLTFKGHIHITLNASDLYNIEGLTIRKKQNGEHYMVQRKRIFLVKDIFAEDLVNTLDSFIELGAKQEDFDNPCPQGARGGRY